MIKWHCDEIVYLFKFAKSKTLCLIHIFGIYAGNESPLSIEESDVVKNRSNAIDVIFEPFDQGILGPSALAIDYQIQIHRNHSRQSNEFCGETVSKAIYESLPGGGCLVAESFEIADLKF
jgi:hypothetical protein